MVPQQPVVAGESFQVQYILEGGEKNALIQPPLFTGCRLITGPNIYHGKSGPNSISNFVYTLEAVRAGRLLIPGTTVYSGNKIYRSNTVYLDIISPAEASRLQGKNTEQPGEGYFLKPGEDPYQKIKENLFVKVQVDKVDCRVGEAVLATFKLYSRLESKSDIVKNPGFYGFTVYDMAGLDDKLTATEKINGRLFDVHTIRKVQLYPLRAGRFTIDPMEVRNRVEFSRTAVSKKTEQQIAEGMMGLEEEETVKEGTDLYESSISTTPVEVLVKPLPEPAPSSAFSGAVGRFTLKGTLSKQSLAKNEQGYFDIIISGAGNFTQLVAPVIQWPEGVEGFEPEIKDELDKMHTPLKGSRIFRYPFVCSAKGKYEWPSISFTFFDRDSNRYQTIYTRPVMLEVTEASAINKTDIERTVSLEERNEKAARKAAIIAVVLVVLILLYWTVGHRGKKPETQLVDIKEELPSVSNLLGPLTGISPEDDRAFYSSLRAAIWECTAACFKLSGSTMNKQDLVDALSLKTDEPELARQLIRVLEICESGIFTGVRLGANRELLLAQTREVLDKVIEQKTT